ncbi:MAG: galactokinase [Defluviitaleaceae bacterium]|nr:galactokinase [Defluviitaleaceae bacterium]
MNLQELQNNFNREFPHSREPRFFYAPGRVNLIGEHIDYNGGYVFPCALTMGTYAAISRRDDNLIRLVSGNIEPAVTVNIEDLSYNPAHSWANNPKGVTKLLADMGHKLGGYDMYIWGNLPNSAGLSSSASLAVLTALALDTIFGLGVSPVERALLCQRVENEYIGVNCGIMDQFASAMGRKDHAILLNCGNLEYEYVPLELGDYQLVIANSNASRALADTKYNERRAECDRALEILRKVADIKNLCDLDSIKFMEYSKAAFGEAVVNHGMHWVTESLAPPDLKDIPPPTEEVTAFIRAYHAVSENERVKYAVAMLKRGDLSALGFAMTCSHVSLRDCYEVTGYALDSLALAAWEFDWLGGPPWDMPLPKIEVPAKNVSLTAKVLGSRMTGAGFGGCTVSIVHKDSVEEFIREVGKRYTELTGLTADFYVAKTDDGAREVY